MTAFLPVIPAGPLALFLGGSPSPGEILLVLVIVLVFFGARRLPQIARNLGRSMEAFRKAARDITDEIVHADPDPDLAKKKEPPAPLSPSDTVAAGSEELEPKEPGPAQGEEDRDARAE